MYRSENTIDIVIPSYRLEKKYVLPLIQLPKPQGWVFNYYIVVDNPAIRVDEEIALLETSGEITLLINQENLGASKSRNKGLEAGNGQWVLFLDDDIKANDDLLHQYVRAIDTHPEEIGFIGLVELPAPPTTFAQAVLVSNSVQIFGVAKEEESYAWGATANILVKREAVGPVRFSTDYPKFGGGEDADFFLNVRDRNQSRNYKTLKEAVAYHPWWHGGRPDFKRPFRYGVGNSFLGEFNPKYTYCDFPNTPEALFLLATALPLVALLTPQCLNVWLQVVIVVVLVEPIALFIQLVKRKASLSIGIIYYVLRLKFAYQIGLLWGTIKRFRFKGIGERFAYQGQVHRNGFFQFSTYKIVKWVLYGVLFLLL